MSAERSIKLNPFWLDDEEGLMKRLEQIISGSGYGPIEKNSGYKWQIDGANSWGAEIRDGELVIAYKQGETEMFNAVIQYLEVYLR